MRQRVGAVLLAAWRRAAGLWWVWLLALFKQLVWDRVVEPMTGVRNRFALGTYPWTGCRWRNQLRWSMRTVQPKPLTLLPESRNPRETRRGLRQPCARDRHRDYYHAKDQAAPSLHVRTLVLPVAVIGLVSALVSGPEVTRRPPRDRCAFAKEFRSPTGRLELPTGGLINLRRRASASRAFVPSRSCVRPGPSSLVAMAIGSLHPSMHSKGSRSSGWGRP